MRVCCICQAYVAEVTELKNLMDNIFASIASGCIDCGCARQNYLVSTNAAEAILGPSNANLVASAWMWHFH